MAAGGGAAAGRAYSFKVVLLGEGCVGKTSLVLRYCENKFNDKHITTLQVRARGAGGLAAAGSGVGAPRSQACHLRLGLALPNSPWGLGTLWTDGQTDCREGSGRPRRWWSPHRRARFPPPSYFRLRPRGLGWPVTSRHPRRLCRSFRNAGCRCGRDVADEGAGNFSADG